MKKILLLLLLINQACFAWNFVEKSIEVGLSYEHSYDNTVAVNEPYMIAGGLAIGDVNGDGWDDIFAVTGENLDTNNVNTNPNKLFISQADGSFIESASEFGLNSTGVGSTGPLIVDLNEDGFRDLIIGSVEHTPIVKLFSNFNNDSFNLEPSSFYNSNTFSISASDVDKDGDLDLFLSHWLNDIEHNYWFNNGQGVFNDVTDSHLSVSPINNTFTSIFADIDNDNNVDLLLTSDFSSSQYFINDSNGIMNQQNSFAINDENGMGGAVGDYDNDGDLDWFVSSIYDPDGVSEGNWGVSGNRLYQNDGNGHFQDVSVSAGVREGYWGWGSCFADFNNDMFLDIFHVNGFPSNLVAEDEFVNDASRLFINNQDGTFTEMSSQLGLNDNGMGRAIICFDNDRDGDIDILVNNNQGFSKFYQNELDNGNHYLAIKLLQTDGNMDAIGAKISLTTNGVTQLRQIIAGGSFASSNPSTQHFGLGNNQIVDSMTITWSDGVTQRFENLATDRLMTITKGQGVQLGVQMVPLTIHSYVLLVFLMLFSLFIYRFRT